MFRAVRIKDHHAEQRLFARRAVFSIVIILLGIVSIVARLVWLQIIKYDYFAELATGNRIRLEPIPPNRGLILDRNGLAMAINKPSYQLELVREQVPDLDRTLKALAEIKLIDAVDIPTIKRDIRARRSFDSVPIKLQLNDEELARFAVRRQDFEGVEIRPRMTRFYPLGPSAVHATGYVSAISEEDKATLKLDEYAGITLTGKSGVERAREEELHGRSGIQQILVNATGRRVDQPGKRGADLKRIEPIAGDDVYLTVDERIQRDIEEHLRGKRASAVAIDPSNGDIIAFVSTPGFDPNLFARGITRPEYRGLMEDIDKPLYDRSLRGAYPSGSTIKPFMALAGLQWGVIGADESWFCRGKFRLPNVSHTWSDWKPAGHGTVSMRTAIQHSCDTYFYNLADMMGIDHIHDFLAEFGFGVSTQIDIGGDKAGLLPSTEWKRRAFKTDQKWYRGETVNVGIGQGYLLVTPLQLAHATATLAARGVAYQPRLVRAIRDSETGKVTELPPVKASSVSVKDEKMWDVIFDGMELVTKPGGTAVQAMAGAQYRVAGKTGTAQVFSLGQNEKYNAKDLTERLHDHGLFVCFAPVDDPKIAIAVVLENGEHGAVAAVIARRLMDLFFLPPDVLAAQDAGAALKAKAKAEAAGARAAGDE